MIKSYILVALRNVRRFKLFSFINIFGLALSLSFCLLVIIMIVDQKSFDGFHDNSRNVYRVLTNAHRKSGATESYASSPQPLADAIKRQSPHVVKSLSLSRGLRGEVVSGLSAIRVEGFFASPGFFDFFGFELREGDPSTALTQPNGIILTDETAEKIFGLEDPVGKRLTIAGLSEFTVTGVLKPFPGKTHLTFDILGSSTALPLLKRAGRPPVVGDWNNYYGTYTYVMLKEGHEADEIQPVLEAIAADSYRDLKLESRDQGYSFELQALSSITPGPILSNEISRALPKQVLFFISFLALAGIIAALFNYTSLTLARSLTRAKEVGIRKVIGASRRQVFSQFISESVVAALLSLAIAVAFLQGILIPGFEQLTFMKDTNLDFVLTVPEFALFLAFTLVIGGIAGILPALVISRFQPAAIFRGFSKMKIFSVVTPRMALVVFQFVLSLVLMIVLTAAIRQLDYAMNPPNAFETKNIVSIDLQGNPAQIVREEMRKHAEVRNMTAVSHHMGTWEDRTDDVRLSAADEPVAVRDYSIDEGFLDNFGLSLVAGSNFDSAMPGKNRNMVLVNEEFLKRFKLGSPADAIGTSLFLDSAEVRIAGIVRNFLYKPLVYQLEPLLLRYEPKNWRNLDIALAGNDVQGAVEYFQSAWKSIDPVHPFEYKLYDDILFDVYSNVRDLMKIVGFLGLMAFVISILGLLGIVTYNAETRIKEIGIRKVLGASAKNLVFLLARNEIIMLLIATAIAIPAGVWISGLLLQAFAFRISVGFGVILPGVAIVYGVSALTVAIQTLRSAGINPVETLRYE